MAKKTTTSKRVVKVEAYGEAHITSTFNNVIVSLTNAQGQVISWGSAGKCGFRGSKKNTPYAAQMAAEDASKTAYDAGLRKVKVFVKGPGSGRESAIRTINNAGIVVTEIVDVTPCAKMRPSPKRSFPSSGILAPILPKGREIVLFSSSIDATATYASLSSKRARETILSFAYRNFMPPSLRAELSFLNAASF